ncbi:hypothetical protein Scep_001179 [Stephania cephalantha]|uniref:DUF674 domain-containing protein n=1 Tax=Stephania cephalantha TaxID=152367 RepID=A0AAP0L7H7_9MAGN
MATTSTEKITVKLLVDRTANKVLFVEAKKDFVDFLIGLLSLPLASVFQVLAKEKMAGALGELYESIGKLDQTYIHSSVNMSRVLKPAAALTFTPSPPQSEAKVDAIKYYSCYHHRKPVQITTHQGALCSYCDNSMETAVTLVGANGGGAVVKASSDGEAGFVEGVVTYMVMDDLVVTPLSTISSIMVLKKFNIENFNCVDELVVDIGMEEGLELLRASLQSKTVLSDFSFPKELPSPTKRRQQYHVSRIKELPSPTNKFNCLCKCACNQTKNSRACSFITFNSVCRIHH